MCELQYNKYYTLMIGRIAIQRFFYYMQSFFDGTLICIFISVTRMRVYIKHIHTPIKKNLPIIIISS